MLKGSGQPIGQPLTDHWPERPPPRGSTSWSSPPAAFLPNWPRTNIWVGTNTNYTSNHLSVFSSSVHLGLGGQAEWVVVKPCLEGGEGRPQTPGPGRLTSREPATVGFSGVITQNMHTMPGGCHENARQLTWRNGQPVMNEHKWGPGGAHFVVG